MLEEIRWPVGKGRPRHDLSCEREAANLCASEIGTAKAVEVGCSGRHFLLEFDRVYHHCECSLRMFVSVVRKALQHPVRFVETILSTKIPGRSVHSLAWDILRRLLGHGGDEGERWMAQEQVLTQVQRSKQSSTAQAMPTVLRTGYDMPTGYQG